MMLSCESCSWRMMKYPIPKEKRLALAKLYFHVCTTPGTPTHIVSTCVDGLVALTRSKKKISVEDLRLPWKPIFDILSKDLFLTRRQFEIG
jgi:proteasome activator subunit 4